MKSVESPLSHWYRQQWGPQKMKSAAEDMGNTSASPIALSFVSLINLVGSSANVPCWRL
jgi:hypothetical protein